MHNRPFSYSENERGSNDISLQFVEVSNVYKIAMEALTPLYRTSSTKLYKNIARSRLFCRIAKRSIVIEALTPLDRTSCIKMDKNNARSRLLCRISKRSINGNVHRKKAKFVLELRNLNQTQSAKLC